MHMPFVLHVHDGRDVLVAQASGNATLVDLRGMAALVGVITARGERRAMLDLVELEVELAFTDHLQLGSYVAEQLQHLERVASVVPERYRTGTSEKAAQKGGLLLRTFADREAARRWLEESAD